MECFGATGALCRTARTCPELWKLLFRPSHPGRMGVGRINVPGIRRTVGAQGSGVKGPRMSVGRQSEEEGLTFFRSGPSLLLPTSALH